MIKYGVVQKQVEELIKLGVCADEESAREAVAKGDAEDLIKQAQENNEEFNMQQILQSTKRKSSY